MVGVEEVVAVDHPEAGVVGVEGDFVGLVGSDAYSIEADRAAGEGMTVLCEDGEGVAVKVHGMNTPNRVVDEEELYQLSGPD